MKTPVQRHSRRFCSSGFSLVEVVLAVGIMALGIVTILGLLPSGINISRQTAIELAENRILDALIGDVQSMNWTDLVSQTNKGGALTRTNRLFDDQGLELTQAQARANGTLSYVARLEIPPSDVQLPTNAKSLTVNNNGTSGNLHLRRVIVKILPEAREGFNFDDPPPGVKFKTYTQLVAKMR